MIVSINDNIEMIHVEADDLIDTLNKNTEAMSESIFLTRQEFDLRITRSNSVMNQVLDNLNHLVYVIDFENHELLFANRLLRDSLAGQYSPGLPCWQLLRPDINAPCPFCQKDKLMDEYGYPTGYTNTHDIYNALVNRWFLVSQTLIEWYNGRQAVVVSCIDITDRKNIEQEMRYLASMDKMTGAYNRSWGLRLLQEFCYNNEETGEPVTVCFIDIDKLKQVNDVFGHAAGDELIQTIASAIKEALSEEDFWVRLGGDEFLITFARADQSAAQEKLEAITKRLNRINASGSFPFRCSVSYGFHTTTPGERMSVDDIIKQADANMYQQKHAHRGKDYTG